VKAVILAGGRGTRISEESHLRPKPMVEIGDKPILWHIMSIYAAHGIEDFIICLGYRGYIIKEYFANFMLHAAKSVTFDFDKDVVSYEQGGSERWRVTLVETGLHTQTGGRLKRLSNILNEEDDFCMTYGDGLSNVDVTAAIAYHKAEGRLATVTTVAPPGRFGTIQSQSGRVTGFSEKPRGDGNRINGGFFVLSPKVLDFVEGDQSIWEHGPMDALVQRGELTAYRHDGFWQPMDTLRERDLLREMWDTGNAPWRMK